MEEQFETKRLIIRPMGEQDAEFLLELLNSPKWLQYIGDRNVHSLDEARAYIRSRVISQHERLGFSNFMVIRKKDGSKIGCCSLVDRDGLDEIDIGFAFLPQYERMGYAFESTSLVKEIALRLYKIPSLSAITIQENIA
ncbi:MAG: GNAT family N-acetyltransferase, partial [Flavobacteriales bacterium]|nr:GNAT family N-acetyltransferase [Flavobacteriales bacterium]